MNTIIDADAAKLAGLLIDTLQKVRSRRITLGQWERFNNLSTDEEITEKFALLVDLGIIIVPDDYDPASRLKTFGKQNRKKFHYYDDNIIDKNFPNPTRILKPGDKLHVRAFRQAVGGTTTSEERMAFLATQKAVHVGAQGASLVFDQKRDQLPKGKGYASFDEKDRLWKDAGGFHRVPFVFCDSDGDFFWHLGYFESVCSGFSVFLCFCDE